MRKRSLWIAYVLVVLLAFGATKAAKAYGAYVDEGWRFVSPSEPVLVHGHSWGYFDHMLKPATELAAGTFAISPSWMRGCNHDEGGDVGRELLRRTLARPLYRRGDGWNNSGSHAFGPWQYMMDRKPASHWWDWGTFETYMTAAFAEARHRGLSVPRSYMRPDSYVGQAIVTAFMFKHGMAGQWQGARC